MGPRAAIGLAVLASLLPATPASAQSPAWRTAVLPIGGDGDASPSLSAVTTVLAEADLGPLAPEDLALRISPTRLAECRAVDCARELGRGAGANLVAAVAAFEDGSLAVSLLPPGEAAFVGRSQPRGSLDAQARVAVGRALERWRAAAEPPGEAEAPGRSLESIVLPVVLGVVGLGLGALAVYALLDETCELRAMSGLCLRGERPNGVLGVTFSVLAVLSVAGAVVWFLAGGETPEGAGQDFDLEVRLGPHEAGLGLRGQW
jgi:hypothetical protein